MTLVEVMVSLSLVSIVVLAAGSTIMLSVRAIPSSEQVDQTRVNLGGVLDQISSELTYANAILQADSMTVEFRIRRRGRDDVIKYAWSGTPGDALIRTEGTTTQRLIESVQSVDFGYVTRSVNDSGSVPLLESAEMLVLQQDTNNSGDGDGFTVTGTAAIAATFTPSGFPPEAVAWRVTRVKYLVSASKPAVETLRVSVRETNPDGTPSASMVESVLEPEGNFTNSPRWYESTFVDARRLDPVTPCCIAIDMGGGSGAAGRIKKGINSFGSPSTLCFTVSDGQPPNTFSEVPGQDLWVWVWGRYSTEDPNWVPPQGGLLKQVDITIDVDGTTDGVLASSVVTLNRPEMVVGP